MLFLTLKLLKKDAMKSFLFQKRYKKKKTYIDIFEDHGLTTMSMFLNSGRGNGIKSLP